MRGIWHCFPFASLERRSQFLVEILSRVVFDPIPVVFWFSVDIPLCSASPVADVKMAGFSSDFVAPWLSPIAVWQHRPAPGNCASSSSARYRSVFLPRGSRDMPPSLPPLLLASWLFFSGDFSLPGFVRSIGFRLSAFGCCLWEYRRRLFPVSSDRLRPRVPCVGCGVFCFGELFERRGCLIEGVSGSRVLPAAASWSE